jgi:tripartite-type tricarboxylate transporter receptor subunit TctC
MIASLRSHGGIGWAIGLILAVGAGAAPAQEPDAWPSRPVRLVVPSSAGGGTDGYARLLAQGLADALKQRFVVDNRPGASGAVGAEIVARAAPDGYTLMVASGSALIINPNLQKNLPYDAERDFIPIARGVVSPNVWTVHPSIPARTVAALVALGKREPGKVNYGTAGPGSTGNIAVKMVEEVSGARFVHVPYRGTGQAVPALLGGEIGFMVSEISGLLPHIRSGRVHAIVCSHRTTLLPAVPTLAEARLPNDAYPTFSVLAPAGTPPAIVQRASAEIVNAMKSPALKDKLEARALIAIYDSPEEFAAVMKKERARFADIIRRNRIAAE